MIAAAQLMLVLDTTIVNVALPSMQKALHLSTGNLNWLVAAYALTFGGLLLVGGRAGDLFGRRAVFRFGLIVFTLASLAGGLAPNSGALIAARLVQGAGAAIAAPTALSLLAVTFPAGPARNKAMGVYGSMGGLGSVVGLLLGGALTEYVSWRWVLFINAPIAVLVLLGTTVLPKGGRERGGLDVPGAVTATLGIGSLVYAINRGTTNGWSDKQTVITFIVGVVLLLAFLFTERGVRAPMIPGRVVKDRNRGSAYLVMFLVGAAMLAMFYFLTLYMQVVRDYSAMHTGLAYLPYVVGILLGAGGVGPQVLGRTSPRIVITLGTVLGAVGLVWYAGLTPTSNYFAVMLPAMLVGGLGAGLIFVSATVVGMAGVAPEDTGIGGRPAEHQPAARRRARPGRAGRGGLDGDPGQAGRHRRGPSLTDGYVAGFLVGAVFFAVAAVVALAAIRTRITELEPH